MNHYIGLMENALRESTIENEYTRAVVQDLIDTKQIVSEYKELLNRQMLEEKANS